VQCGRETLLRIVGRFIRCCDHVCVHNRRREISSLATPLSSALRYRTGGFASPSFDGFALFNFNFDSNFFFDT
jgi:hypothetical protein